MRQPVDTCCGCFLSLRKCLVACIALVSFPAIMHPAAAQSPPNPDHGLAVATHWCNSCHMVSQNDAGMDDAEVGPRFSALTSYTAQRLKNLLAAGHADMAALAMLSDNDVADIAAYLHRLNPEPRTR